MNTLIKIEEATLFIACLIFYPFLGYSWLWFAACILLPDASMIGYLVNNKIGAYAYNIFHHRAIALIIAVVGYYLDNSLLLFSGYILFTHATMDRIFGYGLKYEQGFKFTHLGEIGKK